MTARRVLLVVKGLDVGGIERIVVDLARGLRRHGADVEVAVVNDRRVALLPALERDGILVHRLGGSDRIGVAAARRLRALVIDPRFDVVHVHGPLVSVVARTARARRPVVTTSHTPWRALHPATRVLWRATAGCDAVTIAVSAAVQASLPTGARRRARVLPHGIDLHAVEAARDAVSSRPEAPADRDEAVALAVASHRDAKNYPNLLRAMAMARGRGARVRLVSVGEGPLLERHRRLAAEWGVADGVEFRPPGDDVLEWMATADLLVVASDYEGQPLVVMEALALGCPVVATAVGRVPELVGPAVGRVVPPGDSDALATAIAELADDAALRARLSAAAVQLGRSWSLDDVLLAHLDLYAQVTAR
jgi:glycosyltransferase involved in cell wall biosynthesis